MPIIPFLKESLNVSLSAQGSLVGPARPYSGDRDTPDCSAQYLHCFEKKTCTAHQQKWSTAQLWDYLHGEFFDSIPTNQLVDLASYVHNSKLPCNSYKQHLPVHQTGKTMLVVHCHSVPTSLSDMMLPKSHYSPLWWPMLSVETGWEKYFTIDINGRKDDVSLDR